MYFYTQQRAVCHILEDIETGRAPAPCGSRVGKLELMRIQAGKPTGRIVAEKPSNVPLCKHCQKAGVEMSAL
jgi:hypothetical protein